MWKILIKNNNVNNITAKEKSPKVKCNFFLKHFVGFNLFEASFPRGWLLVTQSDANWLLVFLNKVLVVDEISRLESEK